MNNKKLWYCTNCDNWLDHICDGDCGCCGCTDQNDAYSRAGCWDCGGVISVKTKEGLKEALIKLRAGNNKK